VQGLGGLKSTVGGPGPPTQGLGGLAGPLDQVVVAVAVHVEQPPVVAAARFAGLQPGGAAAVGECELLQAVFGADDDGGVGLPVGGGHHAKQLAAAGVAAGKQVPRAAACPLRRRAVVVAGQPQHPVGVRSQHVDLCGAVAVQIGKGRVDRRLTQGHFDVLQLGGHGQLVGGRAGSRCVIVGRRVAPAVDVQPGVADVDHHDLVAAVAIEVAGAQGRERGQSKKGGAKPGVTQTELQIWQRLKRVGYA